MSIRKYRHADGTGRKRSARTRDPMDLEAAVVWLREQVGAGGYEAMMPRGTEVEFYSPMTPEEVASEAAYKAASDERTEKYERETYERLRAKYEETP